MKKILIILVAIFGMNLTYGQESTPVDTVYMIGTPIRNTEKGLRRDSWDKLKNSHMYKYPPIHIKIVSKEKDIWIPFTHYNYNPVEVAKKRPVEPLDEMVILTKPIEFLQTIKLIDLDVMLPTLLSSKNTAESFGSNYRGKIIFFIDRNDITATTVKLIQVKYNMPDDY